MSRPTATGRLRWTTIDQDPALPGFVERVTHPEFAGIDFLHVRAKSLVNHVPSASGMPFEWTINVYRGCAHACTYCAVGETPVLMADGRTKPLADVRVGDRVYGTVRRATYRRYVATRVLDHWSTVKPAYRVTLEDGTTLVTSGDHRFLSDRGWKHVIGSERGPLRRPHLTVSNRLMGTGHFAAPPKDTADYRRGYLGAMIRGDGHVGSYRYVRPGRSSGDVPRLPPALVDVEALERTRDYLDDAGVPTREFAIQAASATRKAMRAIGTSSLAGVTAVRRIIEWPDSPSADWCKGFLAGSFDAEGGCGDDGVLRITSKDPVVLEWVASCLRRFEFDVAVDKAESNGCVSLRPRGGLREHLRFCHTVEPAVTRNRTIEGQAIENDTALHVVSVEALGIDVPMYDITTGTGDYIADGVVSHNCFARPTHTYLELDAGRDFESVIVVKVNAVERLRAELRSARWPGQHVAMGTNTDPYQRCEGRYRLTRGVVETLTAAGNPFSLLTKGTLVLRDLDVLIEAQRRVDGGVPVNLSIPTLDEDVWRASEPGTPNPRRRMEAVATLNDAGVPSGVMVAPIIPGISDSEAQLDEVVRAAVAAGATSISPIVLHLRPGVKEQFLPWLESFRPDLLDRYRQLYRSGYAPKDVQREIGDRVRRLVERHGGPRRHRAPRAMRTSGRPVGRDATPADAGGEQLRLELPQGSDETG